MQIDDHPEPHIHSQSLICVVLLLSFILDLQEISYLHT